MFLKRVPIKIPNTLSFRLTLWYATLFVSFLVMALLVSYLLINSILNARMDDDLAEDIMEFQLIMKTNGIQRIISELEREASAGNAEYVILRLLNKNGELIYSTNSTYWKGLEVNPETAKQVMRSNAEPVLSTQKIDSQEYATRIIYGRISPDTVLQIGESLEEKEEIMDLILGVFTLMFVLVIPIASGIGWLIARKAVRGIEEVSQAAIDIRRGEFERRVSVKTHASEIQTLVDTFNAMAERIRNLISEMREMIDNIAHDLRSPLARIRAVSEATLNEESSSDDCKVSAAYTIEECDRLIQLINTTLDVAEAEADVGRNVVEQVGLSDLIQDACELFEPLAEKKGISLSYEIEPACQFQGNKQNLQRMLVNLLDNALKYTHANGSVEVILNRNNDRYLITIKDTGIGIPEQEQHRVFDRFYRCDQSRSQGGCGLGLSFARAVVKAHDGNIELQSSVNEGSNFTVSLPC